MIRQPSVQEALKRFREDFKGEPGHTPVLGVDYFTQEQIQSVVDYIISQVKKGTDGIDGQDGADGVDGADGKDGKDGKPGRAGETPQLGIHYWTDEHQKKVVADAIKLLEPKLPTVERVLAKMPKNERKIKYSEIEDAPDPESVPKLIEFLKRGGFRGGAGTSTGGGGVSVSTPTGIVDGTNKVFTATSTPSMVCADGIWRVNGFGCTIVGTTITMDIAPQDFIRYM